MSDLRMELIQGQLNDIEENVRSIKATWGNTIMTLDNIKSSLKGDRQKAIEEAYQKGLEEGKKQAKVQAHLDVCHDIDRVAHGNYQKGLDDAWETIIKIALIPYAQRSETFDGQQDILSIMQKFSPSEVTAKLREYEQQKANEIKVGDEVTAAWGNAVVVRKYTDKDGVERCEYWYYENARISCDVTSNLRKTGRHFPQVEELIKAMKE